MSLLLRIFTIASFFNEISTILPHDAGITECDELKSKVIVELFKSKVSVFFLTDKTFQNPSTIRICEIFIPLLQVEDVNVIPNERQISKSIMIDFDLNSGMIIEGSMEFIEKIVLPRVANFNHKMRILLLIHESRSDTDLVELFSN